MELVNRAATAVACCVLGLVVGILGLVLFQRGIGSRPLLVPPAASDDEILMRRSTSPQAADAIALRTMELLKARERISSLEGENTQRALAAAKIGRENAELRDEVDRLRREQNSSLDLLISLLADSDTVPVAPPATTPRSENVAVPFPFDELREWEHLLETEEMRIELEQIQATLNAIQAQQALAVTSLRDDWQRSEGAALQAIKAAGSAVVPALINQLESEQPGVRRWAARALKTLGPDAIDALPSLRLARSDPDESVRSEVEGALRTVGD